VYTVLFFFHSSGRTSGRTRCSGKKPTTKNVASQQRASGAVATFLKNAPGSGHWLDLVVVAAVLFVGGYAVRRGIRTPQVRATMCSTTHRQLTGADVRYGQQAFREAVLIALEQKNRLIYEAAPDLEASWPVGFSLPSLTSDGSCPWFA
jgi:hypothetical protein